MHMQLAERRVALQHRVRRLVIEALDELLGSAVLNGRAAAIGGKQAWPGERRENDAHAGAS